METNTASPSRTGTCTQAHRCNGCGRTFWIPSSWNGINVKCPHCARVH